MTSVQLVVVGAGPGGYAAAFLAADLGLSVALVDPATGSCCDGLHPDRANENLGGESVLSYLLSLAEIRQLARSNIELARPQPLRALRA